MMKTLKISILLLVSSLALNVKASDFECPSSSNELQCVLRHYPAVFRDSPDYFWKVLNRSRDSALRCGSVRAAADFLSVVRMSNPGADFEEFLSEGIETLCVRKPACFKQAMKRLDKTSQLHVKMKLDSPLYFEPSKIAVCQ
jgi:hypothetical protein